MAGMYLEKYTQRTDQDIHDFCITLRIQTLP